MNNNNNRDESGTEETFLLDNKSKSSHIDNEKIQH